MATKDKAAEPQTGGTDQGFFGQKADPTPNDNYTVAGVTSGKPTPETDKDTAAKAAGTASSARSRFTER